MSLKDLETKGLIKKFESSKEEINDLLEISKRDIKTAKKLKKGETDWAFNIAYNALIQTGRAWMFFNGWRPTGDNSHIAVVEFLSKTLKKGYEKLDYLKTMRRKRHKLIYEKSGVVSETEVEYAIDLAEFLFEKISKKIKRIK